MTSSSGRGSVATLMDAESAELVVHGAVGASVPLICNSVLGDTVSVSQVTDTC